MEALVVNILDMLNISGEKEVQEELSAFSSPQNDEIETFIKSKAVDFAKRKLSVTYLVLDPNNGAFLGYFTLTHKAIDVNEINLSETSKKKLGRHAKYDAESCTFTVSAFLLAQFGKNYAID